MTAQQALRSFIALAPGAILTRFALIARAGGRHDRRPRRISGCHQCNDAVFAAHRLGRASRELSRRRHDRLRDLSSPGGSRDPRSGGAAHRRQWSDRPRWQQPRYPRCGEYAAGAGQVAVGRRFRKPSLRQARIGPDPAGQLPQTARKHRPRRLRAAGRRAARVTADQRRPGRADPSRPASDDRVAATLRHRRRRPTLRAGAGVQPVRHPVHRRGRSPRPGGVGRAAQGAPPGDRQLLGRPISRSAAETSDIGRRSATRSHRLQRRATDRRQPRAKEDASRTAMRYGAPLPFSRQLRQALHRFLTALS